MTKYSFHIDPKEPGDDMINRKKDFGRVMHQYQKMTHPLYRTPLYRYRKVFLTLLLVLVSVWLVVEFGEDDPKPEKKQAPADSVRLDSARSESLH